MKKFLVIGHQNAVCYKQFFPYIKNRTVFIGFNEVKKFITPDNAIVSQNSVFYTNIEINKQVEPLVLTEHYSPEKYPKYDNYDAINVNKLSEIPCDYYGAMGVPITFLFHYNPEQFAVIGADFEYAAPVRQSDGKKGIDRFYLRERERERETALQPNTYSEIPSLMNDPKMTKINGVSKYARVLVILK